VLLVAVVILAATGAAGWVLTRQLVDLATKLPDYKENIQTKLRSIRFPTRDVFARFSKTVEELRKDLPGAATSTPPAIKPETSVALTPKPAPAASLQVVETSSVTPMGLVHYLIVPLVGPLGKAALVVLLVIFMLLRREDLRRRLIRLLGKDHISATTHAMDDAGARVFSLSAMQLVVNVS
jgi:predicted PurR-regulated permease PerM